VIRRYAQGRLDQGYDLVLLGHFHQARVYPLDGGEARILPAWYEHPEILWLEDFAGDPALAEESKAQ
jgi:hypothetical protein